LSAIEAKCKNQSALRSRVRKVLASERVMKILSSAATGESVNSRKWLAVAGMGLAALGPILLAGCSSQPGRVPVVDVDPWDAAGKAIKLYDSDGDGKLSEAELRSVPGIFKWKQLYDLDSDDFVTAAEIAARLEKWQADKLGLLSMSARVRLNGRPMPGVEVVLTAEPYLGDAVKSASGVTNAQGYTALSVSRDDLPQAIKDRGARIGGVYPGTYKIAVSHPRQRLPETSTDGLPLGDEIGLDTIGTYVDIELSSR
jgi:hypothetical protein